MTLRGKLAVRILALLLPLLAGGWVWSASRAWRLLEASTGERVLRAMVEDGRRACEADPEGFVATPGRGTRLERVARRDLPRFAAEALRARPYVGRWVFEGPYVGELYAALPWDGPCAVVRYRWASPPGLGPARASLRLGLGVLGAGAVLFALSYAAASGLAERTRRLAAKVRRRAGGVAAEAPRGDELDALEHALDDAARRLEAAADRERERADVLRGFVADVTHDVATPLSVLQADLAELARRGDAPLEHERLARMTSEVHFLASVLDNLVMQARARLGETAVVHEVVDLRDVVERVAVRHQAFASAREIVLDVALPDAPVRVRLDPTAAQQAVGNLLHNAIAHGEEGGHAGLVLDGEHGHFELGVVSAGAHAGPEHLRALAAGELAPEGRPGGLGLRIAARAAADHGWTLSFAQGPDDTLVATLRGPLAG